MTLDPEERIIVHFARFPARRRHGHARGDDRLRDLWPARAAQWTKWQPQRHPVHAWLHRQPPFRRPQPGYTRPGGHGGAGLAIRDFDGGAHWRGIGRKVERDRSLREGVDDTGRAHEGGPRASRTAVRCWLAVLDEVRPLALMTDGKPDPAAPVFPGPRRSLPLCNMVFLMLLRRMGRDDVTAHGFGRRFRIGRRSSPHTRAKRLRWRSRMRSKTRLRPRIGGATSSQRDAG